MHAVDPKSDLLQGFVTDCEMNGVVEKSHSRLSILPNVLSCIGNTPLVKINRIAEEEGIKCELLAKCEYQNPAGSLKDRVALRMILEAEKEGKLKPGMTVIEPTSGNTGISVALTCAVLGYKCIICINDKMTQEKVDTITSLGATAIRANKLAHEDSPESHLGLARKLQQIIPNSFVPNQYDNPMNPQAHYDTTAEEIIEACDGKLDMVVIAAGTCGTLVGIAKKMKERMPHVKVVGVDGEGSILAPNSDPNLKTQFLVEGIGHKFYPGVYDPSNVDEWVKVRDYESFNMARRIIRSEGLLVGGSSGAVLWAALQVAKRLEKGQRCVVVLADSIRNYLTHFVSNDWMASKSIAVDPITDRQWRKQPISEKSVSPASVPPPGDMNVKQAADLMVAENKRFLVAQDKSGFCTGVVTRENLLFALKAGKSGPDQPLTEILCTNIGLIHGSGKVGDLADIFTKQPFILVSNDTNFGPRLTTKQLLGVIEPDAVFQSLAASGSV